VNVATVQLPAGAGNVVTVFVPGLAAIFAVPGALTITIPEPPAAPSLSGPGGCPAPPPPPPVLTDPGVPCTTTY
jgi:hypothetical protein